MSDAETAYVLNVADRLDDILEALSVLKVLRDAAARA